MSIIWPNNNINMVYNKYARICQNSIIYLLKYMYTYYAWKTNKVKWTIRVSKFVDEIIRLYLYLADKQIQIEQNEQEYVSNLSIK